MRQGDLQEVKLEIPNPPNSSIACTDVMNRVSPHSALILVVGLPDRCHRHRPDWVRVAINGGMVKSPELEQTILSAFHKTCHAIAIQFVFYI